MAGVVPPTFGIGNAAMNNSMSSPQFILKLSMILFLFVQAIRQLVLVNDQASGGDSAVESKAGQVATWMTTVMTLVIAALLYPKTLDRKQTIFGLFILFIGAMGSGIAMVYNVLSKGKKTEKNRLWFGIAHVVLALFVLMFLLYNLLR